MTTRPRLRFSIRTLFVVVTVFGCWLSYELNWIRQRREAIADKRVQFDEYEFDPFATTTPSAKTVVAAPGLLWLFGERGYPFINVEVSGENPDSGDELELERVRDLFPEAKIDFWWRDKPEVERETPDNIPNYDGFSLSLLKKKLDGLGVNVGQVCW